MAKKLISLDDAQPAGSRLPAAVRTDLNATYAPVGTVPQAYRDYVAANAGGGGAGSILEVQDAIGEYAWLYPTAVYTETPSPRTYFGAISATGKVLACMFDHGTGRTRRVEIGTSIIDDHCVPAASVGQGPQVWAWTDHSANNLVKYRVGDATGDLDTLGPERTYNTGGLASYTHVIRNPSNPLDVWLLSRTWPSNQPYNWIIIKGNIDPVAKSITWGTRRKLIEFAQGDQGYITVAPTMLGNDYGIRFAVVGNPTNGTLHTVYYGTINLVTGAVASPGKTLTHNVVDGTALPLAPGDLDVAFTPQEGYTTRLSAVRDGGDPAVFIATWEKGASNPVATYKHLTRREGTTSATPGLVLASTNDYADTPTKAAFDQQSLKVRLHGKPGVWATTSGVLARKFNGTGNQRSWQFGTTGGGALRLQTFANGVTAVTTDSSTPIDPDAVGAGFDFIGNNGTGRSTRFWQTLDGETWTQVGNTITGASTTILATTSAVEVGRFAGRVRKFEMFDSYDGSTLIAAVDFTSSSQWTHGQTTGATGTDPQGNVWTLRGTAPVIEINAPGGWVAEDLGTAGAPFGSGTYYGMGAYPIPNKGDVLYLSRENAGTWTIEKWSKASGAWQSRVLASSATEKLARPMAITGQGPLETIYSAIKTYAGYTNYTADYHGV